MPSPVSFHVIVIWEHELVAAARALGRLRNPDFDEHDVRAAIKACDAAIYSTELASGDCPITVMACRETVSVSKTTVNTPKP